MSSTGARRTILGALAAIVTLAAVREVRGGDMPSPRLIVGGIIAAVLLSALAGPLPQPAAGVALIALISTAVIVGPGTFQLPSVS